MALFRKRDAWAAEPEVARSGFRDLLVSLLHVGGASHRLSDETRMREVRTLDAERLLRLGDPLPTVTAAQAFAVELEARAQQVASS